MRFFKKGNKNKTSFTSSNLALAFTCGGENFYEFKDEVQLPVDRAFEAMQIYEMLEWKCTREYLIAHTQAIRNKVNARSNEMQSYEISIMNEDLSARLEFAFEPELLYQLASVVYLAKDEDPYSYNSKLGAEKIQFWKENNFMATLKKKPLKELIPSYTDFDSVMPVYIMEILKISKRQYNRILKNLSMDELKSENSKLLQQQLEGINLSLKLLESQLQDFMK